MKKIIALSTLLMLIHTAFAQDATTCSEVIKDMATVTQQQTAISEQLVSTIDKYTFIPEQQRAVLKRDASIIAKNASKNIASMKSMVDSKKIGQDGCVGLGNDTLGMLKNTIAINKGVLASAQAVQAKRNDIIQQSKCQDDTSCNAALYKQFGELVSPVLQKNLSEMAARAQKMGLVQPINNPSTAAKK